MARYQAGDRDALAGFCEAYWYPVYGFIRHWGRGVEDAEDLTQDFLLRVIEKESLAKAEEQKGKLRSYLLVMLKRFLADDHDFRNAAKRGGKATKVSIDSGKAEEQLAGEFATELTPEHFFDRQWALALLEAVLHELEAEYDRSRKRRIFLALKGTLSLQGPDHELRYADMAGELGITENAVKIAAYRLRQRYRQLLHQHILETVDSPTEVESELAYLCTVLGRV